MAMNRRGVAHRCSEVAHPADQRAVEHLWTKHRIALRAENFYSRVPEVYDVPTMIRISLVHYNTPEEVEMLLKGLDELDQP